MDVVTAELLFFCTLPKQMSTTPPNSDEEEFVKQPINTYCITTRLRGEILMHPMYPRLSADIREVVENGGSLLLKFHMIYHDFLFAIYVYLVDGINYRLPSGKNLFQVRHD